MLRVMRVLLCAVALVAALHAGHVAEKEQSTAAALADLLQTVRRGVSLQQAGAEERQRVSGEWSSISAGAPTILHALKKLRARLEVRLDMELAVEHRERAEREAQKRSPIPTAVPRVYEQAAVHLVPPPMPASPLQLVLAERAKAAHAEAQRAAERTQAAAPAQRGRPGPGRGGAGSVSIEVLPNGAPKAGGVAAPTGGHDGASLLVSTRQPQDTVVLPSELLSARLRWLAARADALPLVHLEGVGGIEDYKGHIIRTFSPSVGEFLLSDIGVSTLDDDAGATVKPHVDLQLADLWQQGPSSKGSGSGRSSSKAKGSSSGSGGSSADTAGTDAQAQPSATEEGESASAWSFHFGGAVFSLSDALHTTAAAADDHATVKLRDPARAGTDGKAKSSKPSSASQSGDGPLLIDPEDIRRRYGLDGKGARSDSRYKRKQGLLSDIFTAYDAAEARTIALVRLLQAAGLVLSPVRICWEAVKLVASGGAAAARVALPASTHAAADTAMAAGVMWWDSTTNATVSWWMQRVWEPAEPYLLPLHRVWRRWAAPLLAPAAWAVGVMWQAPAQIAAYVWPPLDMGYSRAEVRALTEMLQLIDNISSDVHSLQREAATGLQLDLRLSLMLPYTVAHTAAGGSIVQLRCALDTPAALAPLYAGPCFTLQLSAPDAATLQLPLHLQSAIGADRGSSTAAVSLTVCPLQYMAWNGTDSFNRTLYTGKLPFAGWSSGGGCEVGLPPAPQLAAAATALAWQSVHNATVALDAHAGVPAPMDLAHQLRTSPRTMLFAAPGHTAGEGQQVQLRCSARSELQLLPQGGGALLLDTPLACHEAQQALLGEVASAVAAADTSTTVG